MSCQQLLPRQDRALSSGVSGTVVGYARDVSSSGERLWSGILQDTRRSSVAPIRENRFNNAEWSQCVDTVEIYVRAFVRTAAGMLWHHGKANDGRSEGDAR